MRPRGVAGRRGERRQRARDEWRRVTERRPSEPGGHVTAALRALRWCLCAGEWGRSLGQRPVAKVKMIL